jgi:hypothetical protein
MMIQVIWQTTPCSLVIIYRRFREACYFHIQGNPKIFFNYPEEGCSKLLRNAGNNLKITQASCLTNLAFSWPQPTKPHFLCSLFTKVVNSSVRWLHISFSMTPAICILHDIKQRTVIIPYRRFRTKIWSQFQGFRIPNQFGILDA